MTEYEEEDMERDAEQFDTDQLNFNRALDHLIDSVSHFKAVGSQDLIEIKPEAWAKMLETLDFARFIVSGLMYTYGINICGHDHDEEEDEDEDFDPGHGKYGDPGDNGAS